MNSRKLVDEEIVLKPPKLPGEVVASLQPFKDDLVKFFDGVKIRIFLQLPACTTDAARAELQYQGKGIDVLKQKLISELER